MIARPSPVPPRLAATLVLLRPIRAGLEVLLTRRPASMRFSANLFVFPGGGLDPGEDFAAAAVRETLEETGISVDPTALVALSRWVTPPSLPIRYDTRFFGVVVTPRTDVLLPSTEVVEWRWLRPTDALEAMAAARLAMWQPTIVTLQQLEPVTDDRALRIAFAPATTGVAAELAAAGPGSRPGVHQTRAGPGGRAFSHVWAGGVEGRAGATVVVGERRWVIIDPGDPTGETTDQILQAADAAGAELAGVVVTSLEPERHAGVEMLASGLGLPVGGPPGSSGLVPYAVTELSDGDAVPFGDAPLRVHLARAAVTTPARWAERAGAIRLSRVDRRGPRESTRSSRA
ncbi:MAG TPA: NUDIX hydrolase [Candidatus Limnocylindrales bacterium]|nr:NUDIX hydrolase [Candidatus Limnocylindrales bacterium]